jgi:hypothetical protein
MLMLSFLSVISLNMHHYPFECLIRPDWPTYGSQFKMVPYFLCDIADQVLTQEMFTIILTSDSLSNFGTLTAEILKMRSMKAGVGAAEAVLY